MTQKINIKNILRSIAATTMVFFGVLILNLSYSPAVLAEDNYNAATDTYQETRNPNRVDTTTEELAQSNLNKAEETKGQTIYENLIEKVDERRKEALKGTEDMTSNK